MAVELDRIRKALRNLDGERALRNLLGRELGYEHEGSRISGDSYPEELEGDPTLFATAGREGRFSVIYTSFHTRGKLSLMAERKVMEMLRNRYPYALHVFSDAEDQLWHFVNVPHAERAGDKQYRRIVVSTGEPSSQPSSGVLCKIVQANFAEFLFDVVPDPKTPVHTRAKRPCVIELYRTYDLSPRRAAPTP